MSEHGARRPRGGVYTHRGTAAIQRMVEFAPGTGALALWIRHVDDDALPDPLHAATDGQTIFYGPGFERLSLEQQTGLVAHEVLHVALRHPQRGEALRRTHGAIDAELFNACADAIVNSSLDHLAWLALPRDGVRLETLLARALGRRQSAEAALLEWDLERLYRTVDDRGRRRQGGGGGGERGTDGGRAGSGAGEGGDAGSVNTPSAGAGTGGERPQPEAGEGGGAGEDGPRARAVRALAAASPRDLLPAAGGGTPEAEAEQAREWRERLLRAHAGDGAHSLLRALLADLPLPRTPWQKVLRTWLVRGLAPLPTPSWSRPARSWIANQGRSPGGRRLPFEPGTSSRRAVSRLALMVDVSGSIDDLLLERFAGEIAAISRRTESPVTLIVGDDRVREVREFAVGECRLLPLEVAGGGGTDFSPLLEEAARRGADLGVVLTDLEGPAAFRPAFPVIWAVPPSQQYLTLPFGRRIVLD